MITNQGLVYVFTGEGKGKTSAALGVAVRAVCSGKKVGWVSWYKEPRWPISEMKLKLKNLKMYFIGRGFYKLPTDHATPKQHRGAAVAGLRLAERLIRKVDLLVLDEVNNAVADKLINLIDLIKLISGRGKTHLILTGRRPSRIILEGADLVTEMKKIKHPFDQGQKAVKGLDY